MPDATIKKFCHTCGCVCLSHIKQTHRSMLCPFCNAMLKNIPVEALGNNKPKNAPDTAGYIKTREDKTPSEDTEKKTKEEEEKEEETPEN